MRRNAWSMVAALVGSLGAVACGDDASAPAADEPVAVGPSLVVVDEDGTAGLHLTGRDGQHAEAELTVEIVDLSTHGLLEFTSGPAPLAVTYSPDPDYTGFDAFTFRVRDPAGNVSVDTVVSLYVAPVNDAPAVADAHVDTDSRTPVAVDVLTAATDPDGGSLRVVAVTAPETGSAAIEAGQTIVYTPAHPASGEAGADSFEFTIRDEAGATATARVNVTVALAPDPTGCRSNPDCAQPRPVCDVVSGACVECLVLGDCAARPGTVCDAGECRCPGGATWCGPDLCVDLQTDGDHCGACGHGCFGACAAGACADPWEPVSAVDAPAARSEHVAVWTGDRMVVWGGKIGPLAADVTDTGGAYDPATWTWSATSPVGAPSARRRPTAVWTGDRMIVWGGASGSTALGTGAAYDPTTDTWTPVTAVNAPVARYDHTAVWADSLGWMIVFGGFDGVNQLASAAAYDPVADAWTQLTAAMVGRQTHTATWDDAGQRMLVYGGIGDDVALPDVALPAGSTPGGVILDPVADLWSTMAQAGQPSARYSHVAALVGGDLFVWGGRSGMSMVGTGALYDLATFSWLLTPAPEPEARYRATAVVVGTPEQVCVWGGQGNAGALGSGALFDPATSTWSEPIPTALSGRAGHTAVSTGPSLIVWGGQDGNLLLGDGAVYTP